MNFQLNTNLIWFQNRSGSRQVPKEVLTISDSIFFRIFNNVNSTYKTNPVVGNWVVLKKTQKNYRKIFTVCESWLTDKEYICSFIPTK